MGCHRGREARRIYSRRLGFLSGRSSTAEYRLPKPRVASSILVARSRNTRGVRFTPHPLSVLFVVEEIRRVVARALALDRYVIERR